MNTNSSPTSIARWKLDKQRLHCGTAHSRAGEDTTTVEGVEECEEYWRPRDYTSEKELATVRTVLVMWLEIDSLNRLNQNLTVENTRVKGQYEEATRQIVGLEHRKGFTIRKSCDCRAIGCDWFLKSDCKEQERKSWWWHAQMQDDAANFALAKNVTATSGVRSIYVRITSPTGGLLGGDGSFTYENRTLGMLHEEELGIWRAGNSSHNVLERFTSISGRNI